MTQEKKEGRGADRQGHGEVFPRASAAACTAGGQSAGEDGGWRHLQQEEPSKADVGITLLGWWWSGGQNSYCSSLLWLKAPALGTSLKCVPWCGLHIQLVPSPPGIAMCHAKESHHSTCLSAVFCELSRCTVAYQPLKLSPVSCTSVSLMTSQHN